MKKLLILTLMLSVVSPMHAFDNDLPDCCTGIGYHNCRSACQMAIGIGVGIAIFAGMIIAVFNDGNSSHCHSH